MFFLKALPDQKTVERTSSGIEGVDAPAILGALVMMQRASVLVRQIDQFFAKHGLSQLRFLILMVIWREPDRDSLQVQEILERIDVSKPVMTRTLASIELENLIIIETMDADRRCRMVHLTDKGKQTLEALLPDYFLLIGNYMHELDHESEN